jgi:hypothetical protein
MNKTILIFLFAVLAGCSTLEKQIPPDSELLSPEKLDISPSFAPYFLRIDLVRQTHQVVTYERNDKGKTVPVTKNVPNDYSPVGVYIGNGVFLDSNMNLFLDVSKITGFAKRESFTVTAAMYSRIFYRAEKQGNNVRVETFTEKGRKVSNIILSENGGIIAGGFLEGDQAVTMTPDSARWRPVGKLGSLLEAEVKRNGNTSSVSGFMWNGRDLSLKDDGSVSFGGLFDFKIRGKAMIFTYHQLFGAFTDEYAVVRSKNRILYYHTGNYRGFIIEFSGDDILVSPAGSPNIGNMRITVK